MVVERGVREGGHGLGNILSGRLDWDVVVLLEVDTGLLLGWVVQDAKELALDAGIGRACNVLAVNPLAVSRTSRSARAAAEAAAAALVANTWLTICTSVELLRLASV
jgi:hypothetical protein